MNAFYALLAYVALRDGTGAVLAARGHLTQTLRRKPEPRAAKPTGES